MSDKSYKILFLDDDEFIRDMYSVKFAQTKHDVHFASNTEEALDMVRKNDDFDAIVFDIIMPAMNGIDFVRKLREEKLAINSAIIALTNQEEIEDKARAKELAVSTYIIKANHIPSEVVALIEDSIEKFKNI